MKPLLIASLALASCGQADEHDQAMDRLVACVERQAPQHKRVPAEQARSDVSVCKSQIEAVARSSVARKLNRPFDRSDAEMRAQFEEKYASLFDAVSRSITEGAIVE